MKRSLLFSILALATAFFALTSAAQAQASRTWVSGVGDDANPCSRTAPCKTFAGAIAQTAAGGEIDALDPGGFGALTITKAITIDGGGGQVASVLVAGTPGITVSAGANDVVTLRNLHITGINQSASGGNNGIKFNSGAQLDVENCVIDNFIGYGIAFWPTGTSFLNVTGSIIDGSWVGGISVAPAGGAARATIDQTKILNNTNGPSGSGIGITAGAPSRVAVLNSTISQNQDGVLATGATALLTIIGSSVVNNGGNGIHASSGASIAIAQSVVAENHLFGVLADAGTSLQSFGTNSLFANASGNGTFTSPALTPMLRLRNPPRL